MGLPCIVVVSGGGPTRGLSYHVGAADAAAAVALRVGSLSCDGQKYDLGSMKMSFHANLQTSSKSAFSYSANLVLLEKTADMDRFSNGTFSLPSANPASSAPLIDAAAGPRSPPR